jgi:hypothetical protein
MTAFGGIGKSAVSIRNGARWMPVRRRHHSRRQQRECVTVLVTAASPLAVAPVDMLKNTLLVQPDAPHI